MALPDSLIQEKYMERLTSISVCQGTECDESRAKIVPMLIEAKCLLD